MKIQNISNRSTSGYSNETSLISQGSLKMSNKEVPKEDNLAKSWQNTVLFDRRLVIVLEVSETFATLSIAWLDREYIIDVRL